MLQIFKHVQRDTWLRLVFRLFLPFFMNDHLIWYCDYIVADRNPQRWLTNVISSDYARALRDQIEQEQSTGEHNGNSQMRGDVLMEEGRSCVSPLQGASQGVQSHRLQSSTKRTDSMVISYEEGESFDQAKERMITSRLPSSKDGEGPVRRANSNDITNFSSREGTSQSLSALPAAPSTSSGSVTRRRRWSTLL